MDLGREEGLGCVLDELGTEDAEYLREVVSGPWLMLGICSLTV